MFWIFWKKCEKKACFVWNFMLKGVSFRDSYV